MWFWKTSVQEIRKMDIPFVFNTNRDTHHLHLFETRRGDKMELVDNYFSFLVPLHDHCSRISFDLDERSQGLHFQKKTGLLWSVL